MFICSGKGCRFWLLGWTTLSHFSGNSKQIKSVVDYGLKSFPNKLISFTSLTLKGHQGGIVNPALWNMF